MIRAVFISCALVLVAACGTADDAPPLTPTIDTATETQTAVAASEAIAIKTLAASTFGCRPEEAKAVLAIVEPLFTEFSDAVARGQSTSRIALTQVISDMQGIRRKLQSAELPCADQVRERMVRGCNAAIDGFLAFQSEEADSVVTAFFDAAVTEIESANDGLLKLQIAALLADD